MLLGFFSNDVVFVLQLSESLFFQSSCGGPNLLYIILESESFLLLVECNFDVCFWAMPM